jgi:hypothetical protein
MHPTLLAIITETNAVAIGIGIVVLIGCYLAFRIAEFIIHKLLILAVLLALGFTAWWYYTAHHG